MLDAIFRTAPPPDRRSFGDIPPIPAPGEAYSAGYVYQSADAFKIAAVVACVGMRAGAFAQIPLKAHRDRGGVPELVPVQPELLTRPSDLVTPAAWKTQMSISRDIWGYAAGLITAVDGAGYPARVEWLCPGHDVIADERGMSIEWRVGGEPAPASRIVHVPSRWVLPGRPLGISPLEYSGLVDLAKRAQDFGRDWFRNGAVPSSIVYSDTPLTGEQADDLAATIRRKWRARKPAVLGTGMKYEKISVAANESQFIETMRQAAADIAISFNLPPERINAATGTKNEYANINSNQQQYLIDSINPDFVVIGEALERYTPRGQYLRWNTGAFLRSDAKSQFEMAEIGIRAKFWSPSEVRSTVLELPPLTDAQLAEFGTTNTVGGVA
jgi:HK97 family phage portal protein